MLMSGACRSIMYIGLADSSTDTWQNPSLGDNKNSEGAWFHNCQDVIFFVPHNISTLLNIKQMHQTLHSIPLFLTLGQYPTIYPSHTNTQVCRAVNLYIVFDLLIALSLYLTTTNRSTIYDVLLLYISCVCTCVTVRASHLMCAN